MNIEDLKKRKKALKLTVADLAYMAELPLSTVSKIMTGETRNPSYVTIEKLDRILYREEMRSRVEAYRAAIEKYVREHPDEDFDGRLFEKMYKKEHGLSDAPIPFAVPAGLYDSNRTRNDRGSLAPYRQELLTVDVFRELGEDRNCELLDGYLIFNNAPGITHQVITQNLGYVIDRYIRDHNGNCRMFNVGVNVRLGDRNDTVLIPDIAVICNPDIIDEYGINGAPDWVIEVVSPSTKKRDYNDKMHKYMSSGVKEYWIVDPEKLRVTTYIEGEPMMAYIYDFEDDIPVYIYDGQLTVSISSLI